MSVDILQGSGLNSLSWQQVTYNQMIAQKQEELTKGTAKIENSYDSQTALLDMQSDQWAKVKASLNNAEIAVDNGEEGTDKIKDILLNMRILIGNFAELKDTEATEGIDLSETKLELQGQFDEYVDEINRIADAYSEAYNPIGRVVSTDWTPNTITYKTDIYNNGQTMTGSYIGADFYIASDDGTLWVPEPGTSSIQQYEIYNTDNEKDSTKADGFTSTRNGLRLDSYDESTGAITITVDPENDAMQVTGTIKFGGMELMQSWFYDGLDSEAGREAALAAIEKAEVLVVGAESNLAGMRATVARDTKKADDGLAALNEERSEAMRGQLTDTYALQIQKQQEIQVLQQAFQTMEQQSAYFETMFMSVQKNPFLDVMG